MIRVVNFVPMVRDYIRDHAALNRLLVGQETGNKLLLLCLLRALDYANHRHWRSSYVVEDFPSTTLLMDLTIIEVLKSICILKARNYLSYSDGGFSVDNEGNLVHYERILARMRAEAEVLLDNVKLSANISGAYGAGLGSEYADLATGYNDWAAALN